jgi:TatA/E family protein of Tat protein translocase
MRDIAHGCLSMLGMLLHPIGRFCGPLLSDLGTPELLIILLVLLLLFGGAKLPKLARSLGEAKQEFERGTKHDDGKPVETFDPSVFKDEVATRIQAAIEQKVEGQEITLAEAPEGGGAQVIDLMEALRASLEKKAPAQAQPARAETRKPPKRAQQAEPAPRKVARK